jgi:hypothetical protein
MTVRDVDLGISTKYPQIFASSNPDAIGNIIDKGSRLNGIISTNWTSNITGPSFIYSEFDCGCGINQVKTNSGRETTRLMYRLVSGEIVAKARNVYLTPLLCIWTTDPIDVVIASGSCFAFLRVHFSYLMQVPRRKYRH